ncbi:MAG: hypothetical protein QOC61_1483 [Acidobacteriota bacterium]|nr:hypothetical protein [Acidobacteriota bacterium]MDT5262479.1 hypothetical protein [Acidobacteriota bacterium]
MSDSSEQLPHEDKTPGQDATDASGDNSLEGAARDGREFARSHLLEELGRDPTVAEIDEWLQQHTEGY